MEKELERLDLLLSRSESVELFCISHELVKRDYITRKTSILKKAYFKEPEKPFWFLISKN